jgi:hypothetical protein
VVAAWSSTAGSSAPRVRSVEEATRSSSRVRRARGHDRRR